MTNTPEKSLTASSAPDKKGIGWWAGFITLAIALAVTEVFVVSVLLSLAATSGGAFLKQGEQVSQAAGTGYLIVLTLLTAIITVPVGAIGVVFASKLSKRHRGQAATILATIGALIWMIQSLIVAGLLSHSGESVLVSMSSWIVPGCCALNALGQIIAAIKIVQKSRLSVPTLPGNSSN